jgi:hypothetical protein
MLILDAEAEIGSFQEGMCIQTLRSAMGIPKENTSCLSAFALRDFVLRIVTNIGNTAGAAVPWSTSEEGVALVEEIMLEGQACGFESRSGFEELCRTIIGFQIKLPLSKSARQALSRPGLSEMQRIEGFRLSLINIRRDSKLTFLPHATRN